MPKKIKTKKIRSSKIKEPKLRGSKVKGPKPVKPKKADDIKEEFETFIPDTLGVFSEGDSDA